MTTTTATRRLWDDLLQRHLLCDAIGLHDAGTDGRCRDCAKPLTDADPVCRDLPMGGAIR
jgi:hypothetical protein